MQAVQGQAQQQEQPNAGEHGTEVEEAVRLVPTPRQYSTDCGFALRFDWAEEARVPGLLEGAGVEHAGIHPMG